MAGVEEALRSWGAQQIDRRGLFVGAGQAGFAVASAVLLASCGRWLPVDEEKSEPVGLPRDAGVTSDQVALLLSPSDNDLEGHRTVVFRPVSIEGLGSLLGLRVDDENKVWPVQPGEGYELREQDGAPQEAPVATRLLGVVAVHGVGADGSPETVRFVTTHPDFAGREIQWGADRVFTVGDAIAHGGVGLLSPIPADAVEQLGPVVQP